MIETISQIGWWTFCIATALGAGSYLLYPLAVWAIGKFLGEHAWRAAEPSVTMLIPAHNEAAVIAAKIENSLRLDYPREKLQVRVISDGSDDGTDEIARGFADRGVEFQRVSPRGGKPRALNEALPQRAGKSC